MQRVCEMCDEPLKTKYATRFCSRGCANRRQAKREITKACEHCGESFNVKPHKIKDGKGHYCSRACYIATVKPPARPCLRCGEDIPQTTWSSESKYCSQACYHAHPRVVQEINPNKVYSTFYRRQRLLALERDGNRCTRCDTAEHLIAHHRVPFRISRSHALDNLVTVCSSCHRQVEMEFQHAEASGRLFAA